MAGTLINPKKQTKGTVGTTTLKSLINDERTKNKFKELLGNKAAGFATKHYKRKCTAARSRATKHFEGWSNSCNIRFTN